MRLVFVHGRAQGDKDPVALLAEWRASLLEGIAKTGLTMPRWQLELPFYGATLDQLLAGLDSPPARDVVAKGAATDDEELGLRGAMILEMAKNAGLRDDEVFEALGPEVAERGPENWSWVQAAFRALDRKSPRRRHLH